MTLRHPIPGYQNGTLFLGTTPVDYFEKLVECREYGVGCMEEIWCMLIMFGLRMQASFVYAMWAGPYEPLGCVGE